MLNIAERPAEAEDRAVPGHWEGDLITGAENKSAIGVLVERTTGYTTLLHLPDNHGAVAVQEAIIAAMAGLPTTLRKTLTWDQGIEMANHAQIAAATGLAIYFCDPHSPWQRGTSENTNGLLRQYFPKSTDLSIHGPGILELVAIEDAGSPVAVLLGKYWRRRTVGASLVPRCQGDGGSRSRSRVGGGGDLGVVGRLGVVRRVVGSGRGDDGLLDRHRAVVVGSCVPVVH